MFPANPVDLFQRVSNLTSELFLVTTIEDLVKVVSRFLESIVDVEYSGFYLYDFQEKRLRLLWAKGFTEEERHEAELTAINRHPGIVFTSGERLYISDTGQDDRALTISSNQRFTVRSRLYVPVLNRDERLGVFGLVSSLPNRFSEFELSVLNFIANTTGTFYSNLLVTQKIEEKNEQITVLSTLSTEDPLPIFRIDYSGKLVFANNASKIILDYYKNRNGEMNLAASFPAFREAIASNENKKQEFEVGDRIFALTFVPVENHRYVNIYGDDVTELKSIEAELRKTSLIAQETANGVIITDAAGIAEWVNNGFERMSGYNLDDLKGKVPGEVLQGPKTNPETIRQISKAIRDQEHIDAEILNYRKDGKEYWVRLQIQPVFDQKGRLTNFISIQQDVTEQREARFALESTTSRLSSLIQSLKEGILVENDQRKVVLTNDEFCNLFKIPVKPEMLIGVDCSASAEQSKSLFLNPDLFISRIEKILQDRVLVIGEELQMADGRFLERDFIPVITGEKYLGVMWKYRDVTQRKLFEAELVQAKHDADAANEAKTMFLARMSHEIRTPLNAIHGISHLLSSSNLTPDQQKLVSNLSVAAENLLWIINEILDFSKLEAGKISLEQNVFCLRDVMDHTFSLFKPSAALKGLRFELYNETNIRNPLMGDRFRLQQVLNNLVGNALKFTDEGSVVLKCELLRETTDHVEILFSVTDTGIGINKEYQSAIFEMFRQEDETISRKYGGTGLGLSISSQLVGLMGGILEVDSRKGEGSRFIFTLTMAKAAQTDQQGSFRIQGIDPERLRSKRILVVEDNEINQFVTRSIIEKWNADVFIASNGQSAVEQLGKSDYDLILMDLEMPVMDGYSATRIIRNQLGLEIPIIALTANVMKQVVEKALDAGISDYLMKPFEPIDLFAKIVSLLSKDSDVGAPEIKTGKHLNQNTCFERLYRLDKLEEAFSADQNQVKAMIRKFLDIGPQYAAEVFDAYEQQNIDGMNRAVHKIKSSLEILGSQQIFDNTRALYDATRDPEKKDRLPVLVEWFRAAFPKLCDQLEQELKQT